MSHTGSRAAARAREKQQRKQVARHTIGNTIPNLLLQSSRARDGVASTEKIYYKPLLSYMSPSTRKSPSRTPQNTISNSSSAGAVQNTSKSNASPYFSSQSPTPFTPSPPSSSVAPQAASPAGPIIRIIQSDTFDAAEDIIRSLSSQELKTARVAVLNMASFLKPGGGVMNGAIAQEESLCHRSTLYPALDKRFYRIKRGTGLYTKDILVFKDSDFNDLNSQDWYWVDVISIAAIKVPDLTLNDEGKPIYKHESDKDETVQKVRLILQMAHQKSLTHLVLGALGCGAYYNPPEEVAKIFRKVLLSEKKRGSLKEIQEIVIAIFDDGINLRVFREVFGNDAEGERGNPVIRQKAGSAGSDVLDQTGGERVYDKEDSDVEEES